MTPSRNEKRRIEQYGLFKGFNGCGIDIGQQNFIYTCFFRSAHNIFEIDMKLRQVKMCMGIDKIHSSTVSPFL
jgi:hypothetical protein